MENDNILSKADDFIKEQKLVWNFRSVDYLLHQEGITLNQLRSCSFLQDGKVIYSKENAVLYLLISGKIENNSLTKEKYNELKDECYSIMDCWRDNFGSIVILHMLLIDILESKHFFMMDGDMQVVNDMVGSGRQPQIAAMHLLKEVESKISQLKQTS